MGSVEIALFVLYPVILMAVAWLVIRRAVRNTRREVEGALRGFLEPSGEGQPSPLALTAQAFARMLAEEVKASISGAMMGQASALSKQLAAGEQDVMMDMAGKQNPLIGALLAFSPSLRKRVAKNPYAAMALSSLDLSKIMGGGGGSGGNGKHPASAGQSSFELGK